MQHLYRKICSLTAAAVTENKTVVLKATYTEGGVTATATTPLTITGGE